MPMLLSGATAAGFLGALDSSKATMLARSFEDVCDIAIFEGKNSTVPTMRVPFFVI
jgi:hypothetical protein